MSTCYPRVLRFVAVVVFGQFAMLLFGCKKNHERVEPSVAFETLQCPEVSVVVSPQQETFHHSKSPYMVFTAAGDNHNVASWLSCGSPNFRIYVSFYGQDRTIEAKLQDIVESVDGLFEGGTSGYKDTFLFNGWQISRNSTHPDHEKYYSFFLGVRYIFMPDDDLTFTAGKLNLFFQINSALGLCYSAASQQFDATNPFQEWQSGLHVPDSLFRGDAFVETGIKCFRRDCFEVFMGAYSPPLFGFGVDYLAESVLFSSDLLNSTNHGVVDVIAVANPPARRNGQREQMLSGHDGVAEYEAFLRNHPGVVNTSWKKNVSRIKNHKCEIQL
jgi:hypothetical protein